MLSTLLWISMWFVIAACVLSIVWTIYKRSAKNSGRTTQTVVTATPATGAAATTTWVQYARTHWIKTTLCIIALLVLIFWVGPLLISKIPGTKTQVVVHVAPPSGKSVGGPLFWNDSETVKNIQLRNRFNQERVVDGVSFVGFVLPGASVKTKFSNYGKSNEQYRAWILDLAASGGKLNSEALGALAVSAHDQNCVARELLELPKPKKRFEEFNINNETPEEGYACNEVYLQCEGSGTPGSIGIDREESKRVHQYVVNIGVNEVSFVLPHKGWRRLVIGAVHHPDYQASLKGGTRAVPLEGHENGDFALEAEVNGEKHVLNRTYLFQPQDMTNNEVKLRMVMPDGMRKDKDLDLESRLKPARVIVLLETT